VHAASKEVFWNMFYLSDDSDSSSDCAAHEVIIVRGTRPRRRLCRSQKDPLIRKNAQFSSNESISSTSQSTSRRCLPQSAISDHEELLNNGPTVPLQYLDELFTEADGIRSRRHGRLLETPKLITNEIPNVTINETNEEKNEAGSSESSERTSSGHELADTQGDDPEVQPETHTAIITTGNQTEGVSVEQSTMTPHAEEAVKKKSDKKEDEDETEKETTQINPHLNVDWSCSLVSAHSEADVLPTSTYSFGLEQSTFCVNSVMVISEPGS